MKHLPLLVVISLCLTGCAGLALTPAPPEADRPSMLTGGELSDEITPTPTAADSAQKPPDSTSTFTPTVPITPTVTPTINPSPTPDVNMITPTITTTVGPDINFTPITPTATPAPVTPIGLVADLGFRPRPNGYPFANYSAVLSTDFTTTDARRMFANDAEFCFDLNRSCQDVRLQLQLFTAYANRLIRGGHCDGFTLTTLRFYLGLDRTTDVRSTAAAAYNLPLNFVRRQIAYYWSLQIPDPVAEAQWRSSQQTPGQLLTQLRTAMAGTPPDPTTLLVYNWQGKPQGHSMTPYAIDYLGKDVWRVRVYDNNWPGDLNRYVEINTGTDTWSYYRGDSRRRTAVTERCGNSSAQTWCGNATSRSLSAVPISIYTQTPLCRNLCRVPAKNGGPAHSLAWSDPDSELLITDETGLRLGVVDEAPIAEIPDSFLSLLPGGLDEPAALIGHLPVSGTFTYTVSRPDAASLTTTVPSEVAIFGPGFAAVASDLTLTGSQQSQIRVTADGTQLVYQSGVTDRTGFKMVLETPDASKAIDIGGLTIGTGRTITLTFDDPRGQFTIDNSRNITSTFDLTYTLITTGTERIFTATDIAIGPTDRDVLDYGAWTGSGPITLTTTSEITSTLPQTISLYNSTSTIYLPLILQ